MHAIWTLLQIKAVAGSCIDNPDEGHPARPISLPIDVRSRVTIHIDQATLDIAQSSAG